MKSINASELNTLVLELGEALVGAELRDVIISGADILLNFGQADHFFWLWVDLNPKSLALIPLDKLPTKMKREKKPIGLFLLTQFKGKQVLAINVLKDFGRVVRLDFASEEEGSDYLDISLFPSGRNLSVYAGKKQVHFLKPKPLEKILSGENYESNLQRSLEELKSEWLQFRKFNNQNNKHLDSKTLPEKSFEKEKKRIQKAIAKVKRQISELGDESDLNTLAQLLMERQSLDVAPEWKKYLDEKSSLGENIEALYKKIKSIKKKRNGAQQRLKDLEGQIAGLESGMHSPSREIKKTSSSQNLLKEAGVKGRRWPIKDELYFYLGKNGKDNLELLRKSKAWHYWFHLRDYPGVHGILECPRKFTLSANLVKMAAQSLVEKQFQSKREAKKGEKFDVIYTQCRYVKPIKGSKAGLVNYQNEKSIRVML